MKDTDALNEMVSERHDLRIELIEMEKSVNRALLLFVMLALALLGIESGTLKMPPGVSQDHLFVALTQVEYFIGLFLLLLLANQSVHAGYIMALETKINGLFGKKITLWESEVVSTYLFHPRCGYTLIATALSFLLLTFYLYVLYRAYNLVNSFFFGAVTILEILVIGSLAVIVWATRKKVHDHISLRLGQSTAQDGHSDRNSGGNP
jgi:hypothetical protein